MTQALATDVKIKNTHDKKLKKDYHITVPYPVIDGKINDYINKIRGTFSLKGFRKGQVPHELIKEKYGKSIMADEADKIISDTMRKLVDENKFKLALSPKIEVKVFETGKDIEFTAVLEIYPHVPEIELNKIKVTKREAEISADDVDEALKKMLKFYRKWNKQDAGYKANMGDAVNIDYVGKIDKQEFEGGAAKGYQLELGSNSFIDDFEKQLVGKKAGDETRIKVKFPKEYHKEEYAGKQAEFEVKLNEVLTGEMPEVSDEFVKKTFGMDNKEKLVEAVKKQLTDSYDNMSRTLFKKEFFDFLNKKYDFELPLGLVDEQLNQLWTEAEESKYKEEKEKKKAKEKKQELAERMIRCGMLLSELAQKNKIEITNDDVNKEFSKIVSRFPGQEKAVIEYYQKNQSAIQQLRGSILEEKAVDFILSQQSLEKKKISLKDFDKVWAKSNEE
ncbi:MAG: trigger factor [Alphaproteobacteria bacterium]|nr:trigger factor [Alphaproteobacteria bacterium]